MASYTQYHGLPDRVTPSLQTTRMNTLLVSGASANSDGPDVISMVNRVLSMDFCVQSDGDLPLC